MKTLTKFALVGPTFLTRSLYLIFLGNRSLVLSFV